MSQATLLIVDNDSNVRESLVKDVLEPAGYKVIAAGSLEEAEQALLGEELIHLSILDIRLMNDDDQNDRSGIELSQQIDPLIPQLFLTAYKPELFPGLSTDRVPIDTGSGFREVFLVSKTEGPEALLDRIDRILSERYREVLPWKRIAVLTSGGDSPGMNAAIRAIVRTAMNEGVEVIGVQDGFEGLVENRTRRLFWNQVSDVLIQSGTILGTARYDRFRQSDVRDQAAQNIVQKQISGLIVIGGDGSMNGTRALVENLNNSGRVLNTVAIPGTIDNDLCGIDMSLGAASAANAMVEELRNMIRPAQALRRIFVCEVMGRYSGYLALQAAIGIGADAVLIPELVVEAHPLCGPDDKRSLKERVLTELTEENFQRQLDDIADQLYAVFATGKRYGFVILAEGIAQLTADRLNRRYVKKHLETRIENWTHAHKPDVREHVIGYPARGSRPSRFDNWLGATLGAEAVRCLLERKTNDIGALSEMVGWSEKEGILRVPFEDVIAQSNRPPKEIWADRPKWQELSRLQQELARPPILKR